MGAAKKVDVEEPTTRTMRTTVGELIAAAMDVAGDNPRAVAKLLMSTQMQRALKARVQVV